MYKGGGSYPLICGTILIAHPAWSVSALSGDCGGMAWFCSMVATGIAFACVFVQSLYGRTRLLPSQPARERTGTAPESGQFTGDMQAPQSITVGTYLGSPAEFALSVEPDPRPLVARVIHHLFAASVIALFGLLQCVEYVYYRRAMRVGINNPSLVLGPLYFLTNQSPTDDWIGYGLLALALPCLLAVVVWPTRKTAWIATLTVWAWLMPAAIDTLSKL
jgi:hypothetical protein